MIVIPDEGAFYSLTHIGFNDRTCQIVLVSQADLSADFDPEDEVAEDEVEYRVRWNNPNSAIWGISR